MDPKDSDYLSCLELHLDIEGDMSEAKGCLEIDKDATNQLLHLKNFQKWKEDSDNAQHDILENWEDENLSSKNSYFRTG